jgi:D-alanyl-D-alanine carboxypeptidase
MGKRVHRNHNNLMGRYPGTDGMKTGFICASGFNVVATASRNGKRLIAVVLGSPSPAVRAVKAAQLFERGFQVSPLSWLTPALGPVNSLQPINVDPPNLRETMCGKNRRRPAAEEDDETLANLPADSPYAVFLSSLRAPNSSGSSLLTDVRLGEPVVVFTGPPKGSAQVAAKSKSNTKDRIVANRSVATASATPWNNLSPSALAHNPPAALVTTGGGIEAVPLPRARPRLTAASPKAAAPKTATKRAKKKAAKKAEPKQ